MFSGAAGTHAQVGAPRPASRALHGDLPPTDATLAACPSVGAILGAVIYNAPLSSGSSD